MKTRRSWRNQDRLWRALGGPIESLKPITVESIERMLQTPGLTSRTKRQLERDMNRARIRAAIARATGEE